MEKKKKGTLTGHTIKKTIMSYSLFMQRGMTFQPTAPPTTTAKTTGGRVASCLQRN